MTEETEHSRAATPYVLGHTEHELERLRTQAALIDPITKRSLIEAGISPGMRVLDIGSGAGHVAARRLGNVSFRDGDPAEHAFDRPAKRLVVAVSPRLR